MRYCPFCQDAGKQVSVKEGLRSTFGDGIGIVFRYHCSCVRGHVWHDDFRRVQIHGEAEITHDCAKVGR